MMKSSTRILKLRSGLRTEPVFQAVLLIVFVLTAVSIGRTEAQTNPSAGGPDPREIPVPPIKTAMGSMPGVNDLPVRKAMPDVLVMNDGTTVTTVEQWKRRREEMKQILEYYAVGRMPPPPGNVKGHEIKSQIVLDGKVKYRLIHLTFGPGEKLELNIGLFTPVDGGPFPTVILPGGTPPGATPLPNLPRPSGQGRGFNALLPVELATPPAAAEGRSRAAAGTHSAAQPAARSGAPGGGFGLGDPADAETVAARNRELFRRGYACVTFNNNDCAEHPSYTIDNFEFSRVFPLKRTPLKNVKKHEGHA
jgi:hypothetical protein